MLILILVAFLVVGCAFLLPKRAWLKLASVLWLLLVTPILGVIPLYCMLSSSARGSLLCRLDAALLADIWISFHPNAQLGMDEWPPITEWQWWVIIPAVLSIAALAAYYCFRWWQESRHKASAGNPVS